MGKIFYMHKNSEHVMIYMLLFLFNVLDIRYGNLCSGSICTSWIIWNISMNVDAWITYAFGYPLSGFVHHFLHTKRSIWKWLLLCDLHVFKLYLNFKYFLHFVWTLSIELWSTLDLDISIFALFIFSLK